MWKAEFTFGILNGWLFLLFFLILNGVFMVIFPKHYKKRILQLPDFNNGILIGLLYAISLNGTFIYSILVSIKYDSVWFMLGVLIFLISGICFALALINYAHTEPTKPVVTGIYQYSRNPQQIFAVFMWIGVGLASTSYILLILSILQLLLAYPTFLAQEEFCVKKYGKAYEDYMKRVPRYIWMI